jgi:hypothetical protein
MVKNPDIRELWKHQGYISGKKTIPENIILLYGSSIYSNLYNKMEKCFELLERPKLDNPPLQEDLNTWHSLCLHLNTPREGFPDFIRINNIIPTGKFTKDKTLAIINAARLKVKLSAYEKRNFEYHKSRGKLKGIVIPMKHRKFGFNLEGAKELEYGTELIDHVHLELKANR